MKAPKNKASAQQHAGAKKVAPKKKLVPAKRRHMPRAKTLALQRLFLEQFANIGVITAASKLCGVDRAMHYRWLQDKEKYPEYGGQFLEASEMAADRAEAEMVRRGIIGWEEPVFGKLPGKETGTGKVGSRRMFSDRMLELCLKARRPEKFRERHEHTGAGGGPIQVQDLTMLTTAELLTRSEALVKLVRKEEKSGR